MHDVKNGTADVTMKVTDKGQTLVDMKGVLKGREENLTASGKMEITQNGTIKSIEFWSAEGKGVIKVSDDEIYKVIEDKNGKMEKMNGKLKDNLKNKGNDLEGEKIGEVILDTVTGDLKQKITLSEQTDGSKTMSLSLKGNQIPDILKTVIALGIKNKNEKGTDIDVGKCLFFKDEPFKELPKLTTDINISEISISGKMTKNNQPEKLNVNLSLSGKDEKGTAHNIKAEAQVAFSDINNTTPDTIDLTGKKSEVVKPGEYINN